MYECPRCSLGRRSDNVVLASVVDVATTKQQDNVNMILIRKKSNTTAR